MKKAFAVLAFAAVLSACGHTKSTSVPVEQPDTEAARVKFVEWCDTNPQTDPEQLRVCECARSQGAVCPQAE